MKNMMVKKGMIAALMLVTAISLSAKRPAPNALRAPAYPIVTIDPYMSAWSISDRLYSSTIRHWSYWRFPLLGAIQVDGAVYRFMGEEEIGRASCRERV